MLVATKPASETSLARVGLATLLLILMAKISIPLPFTMVPLSFVPQAILLLVARLGRKEAVAATLSYLGVGALGVPVFSTAGAGLAHFFGPTGGYLLGYLAAASFTGYLLERTKISLPLALALGNALIFVPGVMHLSLFVGFWQAVLLGLLPFVAGEACKLCLTIRLATR